MTRGIWIKWIVGGIILLIIVAGACVLWYRHDTAAGRKAAAEADKVLQEWKANKEQKPPIKAGSRVNPTPAESTTQTAEKHTTDTTQDNDTPTTIAPLIMDVPLKEKAENKRISPHGFGAYPEIPTNFPLSPPDWESCDKSDELTYRVLIKAWNKGERFVGARTDSHTGKIYINYPNTVYMRYVEIVEPDGSISKMRDVSGAPGISVPPPGVDFPSHIRVLDYDLDGIDPYEYLDLPN